MNLQQWLFLWLSVLVFGFLTLRPPWVAVHARPASVLGGVPYEEPFGSHFVWSDLQAARTSVRVDFQRLILEWLVLAAITGALLWSFQGRSSWDVRKSSQRLLRFFATTGRKRGVRATILVLGLLLMCGPASFQSVGCRRQVALYSAQVAEFSHRIPELALRYPERTDSSGVAATSSPDYQVVDTESPYNVPGIGQVYFSDRMSGREIADALRTKYPDCPAWYLDAVAANVDLNAVPATEMPTNPPLPFNLWEALRHNLVMESIGLALVAVVVLFGNATPQGV